MKYRDKLVPLVGLGSSSAEGRPGRWALASIPGRCVALRRPVPNLSGAWHWVEPYSLSTGLHRVVGGMSIWFTGLTSSSGTTTMLRVQGQTVVGQFCRNLIAINGRRRRHVVCMAGGAVTEEPGPCSKRRMEYWCRTSVLSQKRLT